MGVTVRIKGSICGMNYVTHKTNKQKRTTKK